MGKKNGREYHSKTSFFLAFAGFCILVIIGVTIFYSGRQLQLASLWRKHTYEVLTEVQKTKANLEESKVTLSAMFIDPTISQEPFNSAQLALQRNLDTLSKLASDNPTQARRIQRLKSLSATKSTIWQRFAAELQHNGKILTDEKYRSLLTSAETSEIHRLLSDIETEEQTLLTQRSGKLESKFINTCILVAVGIGISFLLFFLSTRLLSNQIRMRESIEAELEVARTKALEASNMKSAFLANMSHEIRTPLNGIIGMLKLFEQTPLNSRQQDYFETIKTSSNALLSLINEILDLSKIESGKLQLEETNFELSSLVRSAVSIVEYSARMKNLEIKIEIDPTVPEFLTGDPLRLRQVLLNLINNAIKFSEQGTIKVRITPKGPDAEGSMHLLFEVIDQGVGFDDDTRKKLFKSFTQGDSSTTRKYGGTGLGLAISKQIVEMMRGKIDVDSVKGIGSRFYFDVNLGVPSTDATISRMANLKPTSMIRGHILIAEDNLINQKVVSEMLATMGCTSRTAENGNAAIAALLSEKFDLVLMDAQMPILDGYEATRRIRKGQAGDDNRAIPILATTANAIKGDIEQCLESGMNDYISKPISYNDLMFKINKWIIQGQHAANPQSLSLLNSEEKRNGHTLLKEVVDIFNQDSPAQVAQMREALSKGDFALLPKLAHNLKSSAAVLGALRLKEIAERIEKLDLASTNIQQMTLLVDSLENELSLVQEYLGKHVRAQYPPEQNL
ncbi:ATP-binding protein [Bdellovibrio sp. HCB288]|uniref:ATP-binding protein n=1 Tax=Bdellovibrio sp. HCB288 TaxID=3394355 RepID=UPI0039B4C8BE